MPAKTDKVVFPCKHPERILDLLDEIVAKDGRWNTRTDAVEHALTDFVEAGFQELFEEYLYKQTSVRLSQELTTKLNVLYEKSDAMRAAIIIFLLIYHYKVIPEDAFTNQIKGKVRE